MRPDIKNKKDLDGLVRLFYDKLLSDTLMRPIFIDAVDLDFEHHFDVLVNFWDNMLFFTGSYQRNAMMPHLKLHQKYPLLAKHFDLWIMHFNNSVDELFEGEKASLAKDKALSIATIMQIKIKQLS